MIAKIEKGKYAATVTINDYSKIPESLQVRLEKNSDTYHVYENNFAVLTFEIDVLFDLLMEELSKYTELLVITNDNQAHWIGDK